MYVVVLNKYDGVIGAYLINFLYCVVSFCFPWFCVLYPMLPVSLDYLFLIALLCSLTFPISIRWFIIGVTKILIVYLTSILHYPFLLQHSDDGRRRAGVLPPLQVKKEPTFHRQPKGNTMLSNPEEVRKHDDI
jgi:hypothetical protein